MMAHQWPYQPRYIAVTSNPQNSVARKPQRYISDTVSIVCLLCVLTTLHGSRPPRDASPLPLHYQHRSVELPRQKREKDMSTEHFARKLSAKSNHMASPDFQKLRRCKPLICSEVKKRVLSGNKNASYDDSAGDRVSGDWSSVRAHGGKGLSRLEDSKKACWETQRLSWDPKDEQNLLS